MSGALAVFLGGGLGALARYGVSLWTAAWFGTAFPVGTLAVNVVGSLAIGLSAGAFGTLGEGARLFFITGLLGGFTTFSAFSLETLDLWQRGEAGTAMAYAAASLILSLGACAIGVLIAR